jgi:histidine phosphotransferase ChpT
MDADDQAACGNPAGADATDRGPMTDPSRPDRLRPDPLRLAELLAVRLCHDLSSPLGTLMGALELAAEDPRSAGESMALANDVSTVLGQRLRLLRAAWGGGAPALGVVEIAAMAEGLHRGRRLRLDFDALDPNGRFTAPAARLVLNVLMLAAESLPTGGVVTLTGDPAGDLTVSISGPRALWPPRFALYLADEGAAWQALGADDDVDASRGLQALLTALLARTTGLRLSFAVSAAAQTAAPLLLSLGG